MTEARSGWSAGLRADSSERVVLAAGKDLATLAALRWVARRSRQHPVEVELVVAGRPADHLVAHRLDELADYLQSMAPGTPVTQQVLVGRPGRVLRRRAGDADLLVLGTNRSTPLTARLPPTLSIRLLEAAPGPAVIVPGDWEPSDGPVVAAVAADGSDEDALAAAAHEAIELGRELVLVHAWHLSDVINPVFVWMLDESPMRDRGAARLATVVAELAERHPALPVRHVLEHGEAARIVARAGTGAELVVLGSHGRSRVERVLLHSVGRAVARRPRCPVLVVPSRSWIGRRDQRP